MAERHRIDGILSLSQLLTSLEGDPDAFIVRGCLRPDHDGIDLFQRLQDEEPSALQTLNSNPLLYEPHSNLTLRRAEYIPSVPTRLLGIDIDTITVPSGVCPTSLEAIDHVVGLLGEEFADTSFYYQFSSSARPDSSLIKVHLWFWMDRPIADGELRRWAKDKKIVDHALYQSVQPHFTSAPKYEGLPDPLPTGRSGFVQTTSDILRLILPELRPRGSESESYCDVDGGSIDEWLDRIRNCASGMHAEILQVTMAWAGQYGKDGAAEFLSTVQAAIRQAPGGAVGCSDRAALSTR